MRPPLGCNAERAPAVAKPNLRQQCRGLRRRIGGQGPECGHSWQRRRWWRHDRMGCGVGFRSARRAARVSAGSLGALALCVLYLLPAGRPLRPWHIVSMVMVYGCERDVRPRGAPACGARRPARECTRTPPRNTNILVATRRTAMVVLLPRPGCWVSVLRPRRAWGPSTCGSSEGKGRLS